MRIGVVSDIHSNLHALEAVLEELAGLAPDILMSAGDIVGYGAHPDECCRRVADKADLSIAGNHDAAALSGDTTGLNPYAAAVTVWTKERLSADSRAYLESLPSSGDFDADEGRVSVHHGSDTDRNEYVYEENVDQDILRRCSSSFVILGHTHVPFVRAFADGMVMNPGAVGQPRDGDPRASFGLLDTRSRACELMRVEYDVEEASEAILRAGLPMMLALRLSVGR
jgi:putative phosphoesterase